MIGIGGKRPPTPWQWSETMRRSALTLFDRLRVLSGCEIRRQLQELSNGLGHLWKGMFGGHTYGQHCFYVGDPGLRINLGCQGDLEKINQRHSASGIGSQECLTNQYNIRPYGGLIFQTNHTRSTRNDTLVGHRHSWTGTEYCHSVLEHYQFVAHPVAEVPLGTYTKWPLRRAHDQGYYHYGKMNRHNQQCTKPYQVGDPDLGSISGSGQTYPSYSSTGSSTPRSIPRQHKVAYLTQYRAKDQNSSMCTSTIRASKNKYPKDASYLRITATSIARGTLDPSQSSNGCSVGSSTSLQRTVAALAQKQKTESKTVFANNLIKNRTRNGFCNQQYGAKGHDSTRVTYEGASNEGKPVGFSSTRFQATGIHREPGTDLVTISGSEETKGPNYTSTGSSAVKSIPLQDIEANLANHLAKVSTNNQGGHALTFQQAAGVPIITW